MNPRAWPAALGTLNWPATLAAKAGARLAQEHLRHRAAATGGELHCVVLDASGSMRRGGALARAKGVALDLLERAVRHGHQVALLALAGGRVLSLAPPQPARRALASRLAAVGGGGGTPLAQALDQAGRWLAQARRAAAGTGLGTRLWLLTDGRSSIAPVRPAAAGQCTVVDLGDPGGNAARHTASRTTHRARGRAQAWAYSWGADYVCLPPTSAPSVPPAPLTQRTDR